MVAETVSPNMDEKSRIDPILKVIHPNDPMHGEFGKL